MPTLSAGRPFLGVSGAQNRNRQSWKRKQLPGKGEPLFYYNREVAEILQVGSKAQLRKSPKGLHREVNLRFLPRPS